MLKTMERIITIADLQQDPDTVVHNAQIQPLIVTSQGRPAAYMLGVQIFDTLIEQLLELEKGELVAHIAEGERQFNHQDYLTLKEAVALAEAKWQEQSA